MRLRWILGLLAVGTVFGVSGAMGSHVPEVDPATVPTGFLATHKDVSSFEIAPIARAVKNHRADVFVWHLRLAPNAATGWHTHPGPAIVTIVRGSLGYQHESQHECMTTWYSAGSGFMDPGFGHVHRGVAGPQGVDLYTTFITPTGTENQTIPTDPPAACS
jgi:hypothetical protein